MAVGIHSNVRNTLSALPTKIILIYPSHSDIKMHILLTILFAFFYGTDKDNCVLNKSKLALVADHFLCSRTLIFQLMSDTVSRNKMPDTI